MLLCAAYPAVDQVTTGVLHALDCEIVGGVTCARETSTLVLEKCEVSRSFAPVLQIDPVL